MNCDLALVQRYFAFNGRQTATNLKKNSIVLPFYHKGLDFSMFNVSIVYRVFFLLVPKSHACVFRLKLNWFPRSLIKAKIWGSSLV